MGLGLGRGAADRQDVPAGLQSASVGLSLSPMPFRGRRQAGISQLYLTGKGNRSYFDVRRSTTSASRRRTCRARFRSSIRCSITTTRFDHPILGGELGYNINFTSLTRDQADFDAITQTALNAGTCTQTADPAIKNPSNCLLRGIPGTYSRFSARSALAAQHHRPVRPSVHAVRVGARRCRRHADQQRAGRVQLHRHRRQQSGARHADRRPGVSLSLHQRAVLGHADHRADRADHRAAERDADRHAGRTKTRRA